MGETKKRRVMRLNETTVKKLPVPEGRAVITWDDRTKGFGVRAYPSGKKSFVLDYRARGRQRRMNIGDWPDWSVSAARTEAKKLKRAVDGGADPMGDRHADREAATVQDLMDRYMEEHAPTKAERSRKDDRSMWEQEIIPRLGKLRVADVTHADVDRLHRDISKRGRPIRANRTIAVLRKACNLARRWELIDRNPATGVRRNPEESRTRYLSPPEIARLSEAMAQHPEQQSCNAIRLLLLTGARRGEVLSATWDQFDLESGMWTKPSAHTKQRKEHKVPLSAPAMELVAKMRAEAERRATEKKETLPPYLFPGEKRLHQLELKRTWYGLCEAAGFVDVVGHRVNEKGERVPITKPNARVHDLRRTYASILASSGASLPLIGALLGHTQTQTTARYAQLFEDPLRQATERVGRVVSGEGDGAEVVPIRKEGA